MLSNAQKDLLDRSPAPLVKSPRTKTFRKEQRASELKRPKSDPSKGINRLAPYKTRKNIPKVKEVKSKQQTTSNNRFYNERKAP